MSITKYLSLVLFVCLFNGIRPIIKKGPEFDTYPEQVHLSYGSMPDQMIVTWVTLDYVNESTVEYGINNFKNVAKGVSEIFIDGGSEKRRINIHRVILSGLLPDSTYSKNILLKFYIF